MARIETVEDARAACWTIGSVRDLEPITDDAGTVHGWTFLAPGLRMQHGWVLTDGRVSPALETYRSAAEQYARNTLGI